MAAKVLIVKVTQEHIPPGYLYSCKPGIFRSWPQALSFLAFVLMVDGLCWMFVVQMMKEAKGW